MDGIIYKILVSAKNGLEYGFIKNIQGEQFYFDGRFLLDGKKMADFYEGDHVEFSAITYEDGKKSAYNIVYVEPESDYVPTPESTGGDKVTKKLKEFYTPGYYRRIDRTRMREEHLKAKSGEYEVLEKLKEILYISHVGHHEMGDGGEVFPFCLVGATEYFKQYIRGRYEFLLVFSHFDNCAWQQNTLRAANIIRKRKEIAERRPLVNFYILIRRCLKNKYCTKPEYRIS